MTPRTGAIVLAIISVAGCASIEEPPPPAADEKSANQPPAVAIAEPPATPQTAPPGKSPPAVPEPRVSEVETLLADFSRLRRLSPAELAREQENARQGFNQSRSDAARVRYAMALAIPGAAASDDARAIELLDPIVKSPGATLHGLAFLMAAYIQEQRKLGAQVAGLQQNVQGLQQNVQGLQQKLDAITKLERSLTGRGESGTVRRR
jgi:hypothetical protein